TFRVASITTVCFGLWPEWQASHADVQLALKEGSSGSGDPPSAKRARDWLVISEIALTLTLLVAAGLVLKSFSRLQSLSLGYEPRALFTARFELSWRIYNNRDKIDTFSKALLDKVRTIPGVQDAAISSNGPLMGGWQTGFWREENPRPQPSDMLNSDLEVVGGDYFQTLKVPLLRGRTIFVRSTMTFASLDRAIHDAATSIDFSLPVFDARPMIDRVRESWGSQRLLSFLFSVFAGLAFTLATIGLYGLLAYTTVKRVR